MEKTLLILKPDAVQKNLVGRVLSKVEANGFKIVRMQMIQLTAERARKFYAVHEGKPFLGELVDYMASGPCVPCVLERDNAIIKLRELMGATNPANAAAGTIRAEFAESIQTNTVHGSDSPESAATEIPFFFPDAL